MRDWNVEKEKLCKQEQRILDIVEKHGWISSRAVCEKLKDMGYLRPRSAFSITSFLIRRDDVLEDRSNYPMKFNIE